MAANSYTSNSNGKRFVWIKLILFLIILSLLLYNIGNYFEEISGKNKIASLYRKAWEDFYTIEPNTIDLGFIGSSHSYCSFDPEIMDEAVGTNSFNFGSPLQHPDSSYFVLKEILKYHKPKTIVFEIYWDMIDDEFDLKQADTVITAVGSEDFEKEFVKEVFPINELVKYIFKPVRFQQDVFNYWNKDLKKAVEEHIVPIDEEKTTHPGVSYLRTRGFIYSDIVIPKEKYYETNQFIGFDGEKWDFDKTQKSYIEKMVALCREENIDIIFVTAPIANISMTHIKNYDLLHNKIAGFAEELDVPYRDYNMINMEKNLFENKNFRDDAHLNYSGVEIFMDDFVNWYREIK